MKASVESRAPEPEEDRLVLLRAPRDTFVALADWNATKVLPVGDAALRLQLELARRGLSTDLRVASTQSALTVDGCDDERALDVADAALQLGLTVLDLAEHEVTHPIRLGERRAITDAFRALRATEEAYFVVEGGPDLSFYLQVIHLDGEIVLEAAGREHVGRLPGVNLARLRLLGFRMPEAPGQNWSRPVDDDGAWIASVATRALAEVYGSSEGAPLQLRTNGL